MIISAINIKNIGISICELSIVGSVRIGAIDKVSEDGKVHDDYRIDYMRKHEERFEKYQESRDSWCV